MKPSTVLSALLFLLGCSALHAQETWTAATSPTTQNLWSVCSGGGQFVAVGEGGTILASPDSVTWTSRFSGKHAWRIKPAGPGAIHDLRERLTRAVAG